MMPSLFVFNIKAISIRPIIFLPNIRFRPYKQVIPLYVAGIVLSSHEPCQHDDFLCSRHDATTQISNLMRTRQLQNRGRHNIGFEGYLKKKHSLAFLTLKINILKTFGKRRWYRLTMPCYPLSSSHSHQHDLVMCDCLRSRRRHDHFFLGRGGGVSTWPDRNDSSSFVLRTTELLDIINSALAIVEEESTLVQQTMVVKNNEVTNIVDSVLVVSARGPHQRDDDCHNASC